MFVKGKNAKFQKIVNFYSRGQNQTRVKSNFLYFFKQVNVKIFRKGKKAKKGQKSKKG